LNEHARRMPGDTLEDKKNVAKYINGQLRQLGLALECPKTKCAATLTANPGHDPARGRYCISLVGSSNESRNTIQGLRELPPLHLIPRPERVESAADLWRKTRRNDEGKNL
jgi:hypothetical protein